MAWPAVTVAVALAGCSPQQDPQRLGQAQSAVFTNGGFETGAAGAPPPSWTVAPFINAGITVQTPQTLAGLDLMTGGKPLTSILNSATGPLTQPDSDLGALASLRWPRYGNQSAIVNLHSSTNFTTGGTKNGQNVNSLSQQMTIGPGDVDPADGKVHVRFVVAPVLQNPAHPANQQPYYMVQLIDLTQGNALLYSDFNLSGAAGIPWKTIADPTGEIDYTDWQLVDISPTAGSLAMGDMVELNVIAAGCSPGGHFGKVYVDGVGSTVPGLFVSGTGPAQLNPTVCPTTATLTYTLNYENGGTTPAAGVQVVFNTPPQTTYASVNAPGLVCTNPGVGNAGPVTCTVPAPVAAGAGGSFQVTVNVACGASGIITAGNYWVQATGITPLLGPHVNTSIGCTVDVECPTGDWCDVSKNTCTPTLANGTPIPTDPGHGVPVLAGVCTAAAGALVCTSGVCDPANNECGYKNGDGPCTGSNGDTVCQSGVCDPDGKCGYANGDGPCAGGTADPTCRSNVCDADNLCGYANGDGPCTGATAPTVCRSAACSTDGNCEPMGGCLVDADCASTQYCDTPTSMCVTKVVNGMPVPTVAGHAPTLNGMCTTGAGTAACASGVCDTDNDCGYANGDGPCTSADGPTVCRSTACSSDGTCVMLGGCNVDDDCTTAGTWCQESTHMCVAQIVNGMPVPTDAPHTDPTLDGTCTTAAGALTCVSLVCDTKDNDCGYANGDGPCDDTNGDVVCRSTICATTGTNSGKCVACVMDSQCPGAVAKCDTTTNTCAECTTSTQCPEDKPICNTASSTCVACNGDFGGTTTEPCGTMAEPFCFLTGSMAGECGKCSTNADCTGHNGNICDTTSGLCTNGCQTDADCLTSQWCDATAPAIGMCQAKLTDGTPLPTSPASVATCTTAVGMRVCLSGDCNPTTNTCGSGCTVDTDCPTGNWCDAVAPATGMCQPKLADGQPLPKTPASVATCTAAVGMRVCVTGVCDPASNTCGTPATCNPACKEGDFCSAQNVCTPLLPDGTGPCTMGSECLSGGCTNSVCDSVVASGNGLSCAMRPASDNSGGGEGGSLLCGMALAAVGLSRRRRARR